MNFYSIRHLRASAIRSHQREHHGDAHAPRSDLNQHCLTFSLSVSPRCRVFSYRDHQGNTVQHFDIPNEHNQLVIVAESVVEQQVLPDVPAFCRRCVGRAGRLDRGRRLLGDAAASTFAVETPAVKLLAAQMALPADDPLMLVQELNQRLFDYFKYVPGNARGLADRRAIISGEGVCQDLPTP